MELSGNFCLPTLPLLLLPPPLLLPLLLLPLLLPPLLLLRHLLLSMTILVFAPLPGLSSSLRRWIVFANTT